MLQVPNNPSQPVKLPVTNSVTDAGNEKSTSEIQAQK